MLHFSWIIYEQHKGKALQQTRMSYFSADSVNEAWSHIHRRLPDTITVRDWLLNEDGYVCWWLIQNGVAEHHAMVRLAFSPEATHLVPRTGNV